MDCSRRAYLAALGGISIGTSGCLPAVTGGPRVGTVTCGERTVQPAFDDALPDSSHDWHTLQHDARRTGYSPGITDSPRTCAKLGWVFELPDGDFGGSRVDAPKAMWSRTISANETRRAIGLEVEDFEQTGEGTAGRAAAAAEPTDGTGPGFGVPVALAAVALLAIAVLVRRWSG